jgi:DNA-binding CsgD family transcriptional regulator
MKQPGLDYADDLLRPSGRDFLTHSDCDLADGSSPAWLRPLGGASCAGTPGRPGNASFLSATHGRLTHREREALERAAAGATNKEVAYDLHIAHSTVRVLLHRAGRKLGASNRAKLLEAFRELAR